MITQETVALAPHLSRTMEWVRALAGAEGHTPPLPLARLAAERGLAPRTFREHLAQLEALGMLRREPAGSDGLRLAVSAGAAVPGRAAPAPPARAMLAEPPADDPLPDNGSLDVVRLLTEAGVYPYLARQLAQCPWVTPAVVAAWIAALGALPEVRNLAGVLVHTLQARERCTPAPRNADPIAAAQLRAAPDLSASGLTVSPPLQRSTPVRRASLAQSPAAPAPAVARHEPMPEAAGDADERAALARLWQQVYAAMATCLSPDICELWLRRARPLGYEQGTLTVAVASALGAEWLGLAGLPRCTEALAALPAGPLTVRFVPAGYGELPASWRQSA